MGGGVLILLPGCRNKAASASAAAVAAPSEILKNFHMQDIRNGIVSMNLKADEGQIFEDDHYAALAKPIVTFYKEGKPSSVMSAPEGKVYLNTHAVEGWGGVTVVTTDSTTLTTDRLNYDPDKQKIMTKDKVHIEKPDSITDGVGLEADPELKHVKVGHERVRQKKAVGTT